MMQCSIDVWFFPYTQVNGDSHLYCKFHQVRLCTWMYCIPISLIAPTVGAGAKIGGGIFYKQLISPQWSKKVFM